MNCTITKPVYVSCHVFVLGIMYLCVSGHVFVLRDIDFASFHGLEFGTVPTVWYFFLILLLNITKYNLCESMQKGH
jgi:hypothetical protein